MTSAAERVARLSPAQRARLEQRLLSRAAQKRPKIPARASGEPVPLSYSQQRMWFTDQLDPDRLVNSVPRFLRLRGELDVDALHAAFQYLVDRHSVLRTTYPLVDGVPMQCVHSSARLELSILEAPDDLENALRVEAHRPFDLARELPMRCSLIRVAERDHLLLLSFHHIASDGWSAGIFDRELSAVYEALLRGQAPLLDPLPIEYSDYAVWQRGLVSAGAYNAQLEYWQQELAGAPSRLMLPTYRPAAAVQSFRGAREHISIPVRLVEQLESLGREAQATLFMVLLASFQAVLGRYSHQPDIVVGSPVSGRSHPDTWGLLGCFINSLALRADLRGDPDFFTLLERVRDTVQGALAHQDLPFDVLVSQVRPLRERVAAPIFQVALVFQNTPPRELSLPGVAIHEMPAETGTAAMDLEVIVTQTRDGLGVKAVYNSDLFDSGLIRGLLSSYLEFLNGVADNPRRPISSVPLLDRTERQRVLDQGAGPVADIPDFTIQRAFEAQVARGPDALAVIAAGAPLTYRQIDERANQVAHALRAHGVGPGSIVGVCLDRSTHLLVGLLGVLKSGGAYLPLDPAYPSERLRFMLGDSGARVVLTLATTAHVLGQLGSTVEVRLDDSDHQNFPTTPVADPASGDDLAYVIYTSGSTGKPKGVMITQRNVANLFQAIDGDLHTGRSPGIWLALTSMSFDISVVELLWTLTRGFRVVLASADITGPALADLLQAEQVTHFQCTPSLIRAVAADPAALERIRNLQLLLLTGEPLPATVAEQVRGASGLRILNLYGPTEITVWATIHPFEEPSPGAIVPIGRPIDNTRLYVVDEAGELVPDGLDGELYIGGAGVARGYIGRPELTSQRFVADRWATDAGAHAYRTGDRVRWLPDGTLEFLGRLDRQIKIRGVRVEPGEIEAWLERHPAVAQAAVVIVDPPGGEHESSLVGYLVSRDDAPPPPAADLKRFLRSFVPDQMIPSSFTFVSALPTTPNGKLDRAALPAPEFPRREVPPPDETGTSDAIEQRLQGIWAEVLGVERVGVHENFFDLGGHSLLAVTLFARVEAAFGVRLPLSSLFPSATIQAQAELVRDRVADASPRCIVTIQSRGSRPPFVCVHALDGDVLRFEPLARALGGDQPFYAVRASGLDGEPVRADESVERIAARYVAQLTAALPPPYFLGGFSSGAVFAYEMARQLSARGHAVSLLAILDSVAPALPEQQGWRDMARSVRHLALDLPDYVANALRPDQMRLKLASTSDRIRHEVRRRRAPSQNMAPLHVLEAVRGFSASHYAVAVAHNAAITRYVPGPYAGRIVLFRSPVHRLLTSHDPTLGWGHLALGGVERHLVPGLHELMLKHPTVDVLAAQLRTAIDQAWQPAAAAGPK